MNAARRSKQDLNTNVKKKLTEHHQHRMPTEESPTGTIGPRPGPVTPKEGVCYEDRDEEGVFACRKGRWFRHLVDEASRFETGREEEEIR